MTSSKEDASKNSQLEITATDRSTIQEVYQTAIDKPADGSIHIGPTYTHSKQEELNDYLTHAVTVYKSRLFQAVTQVSFFPSPYKFLNSFDTEDAPIFYGRTNAVVQLH